MLLKNIIYSTESISRSPNSGSDGFQNKPLEFEGVQGIFSIRFATSNAKEMALNLEHVFGLEKIAQLGLENGNPFLSTHVLRKNNVVFEIMTTLEPPLNSYASQMDLKNRQTVSIDLDIKIKFENILMDILGIHEKQMILEALKYRTVRKLMIEHDNVDKDKLEALLLEAKTASSLDKFVATHGMGVSDIVFTVKNLRKVFAKAIAAGAVIICHPRVVGDNQGSVLIATIGVPFSDLQHTLVENLNYSGVYLPKYAKCDPVQNSSKADSLLCEIDHCVQNFSWNELTANAKFYISAFGLHKFWSVDENDVSTENSGLRSVVLTNFNGNVIMPMNEPVKSKMRGQIEEFYDFYGGPGVQHIALKTNDIITTVGFLKSRGLEFNTISDNYYREVEKRLLYYNIELHEPFDLLKEHQILADFDPNTRFKQKNGKFHCHYILQIFSKPIHDRPTFFFEIIQRHNHNGFGKGTFKGLFESIEEQQKLRGTLIPTEDETNDSQF